MIFSVVPVKRFARAKSRLAGVFSPDERRALARAMLADVFDALAGARRLAGVLVVTGEEEARAMAAARGFEPVEDVREAGVNAAAALGLARLGARGAAALIAPCDIPLLTAREVDECVQALETAPAAIAPATRDGGTNLLAMTPAGLLAPAFGPDSAARHVAQARALGLEPALLRLRGASRDIDVPADLAQLEGPGASRTRAFLARAGIFSAEERSSP